MTLKSDRTNLAFVGLAFLALLLLSILCFSYEGTAWLGAVVLIFALFFTVRWYITVFRVVTLSESGATIRLFKWERRYTWKELTCYYLDKRYALTFTKPQYDEMIVFVPAGKKYPKGMWPFYYCLLIHPFSVFYANFPVEPEPRYSGHEVYLADKGELLQKLEAWGAEIVR